MAEQVISLDLATEAGKEEAVAEAIVDQQFAPIAPMSLASKPKAWSAGSTYAVGDLVEDEEKPNVYYRNIEAGNKAHKPSEDTDWTKWVPVNLTFYPLQSASYLNPPGSPVSARHEP